jgi:hypothetical protein
MNLVSLLILPVVITQESHTGVRYGIAASASVIVLAAILWSKRGTVSMGD